VERGLVDRQADKGDKRRSILRLTPEGVEVAQKAVALGFTVTDRVLEPLNARDRERVMTLLARLV
jgi:DNA-binding MarR family transcriptional regulator